MVTVCILNTNFKVSNTKEILIVHFFVYLCSTWQKSLEYIFKSAVVNLHYHLFQAY